MYFLHKRTLLSTALLMAFSMAHAADPVGVWIEGTLNADENFININVDEAALVSGWSATTTAGVYVGTNTQAIFSGDTTKVAIQNQLTDKQTSGFAIQGGATVAFSAKDTIIDVKSLGSSGKFGFGLIIEDAGSSAIFDGNNVSITTQQDNHTAQSFSVFGGTSASFNNVGDVYIEAKSKVSVTGANIYGETVFNNKGNVVIHSEILDGGTSLINAVGLQSWNSNFKVTENVGTFKISVLGQGVDNNGTTYSTGSIAMALEAAHAELNSKVVDISIVAPSDSEVTAPPSMTAKDAIGVQVLDGINAYPNPTEFYGSSFITGEDTQLNINVDTGLIPSNAYGLLVESNATEAFDPDSSSDTFASFVKISGDANITAKGETATAVTLQNTHDDEHGFPLVNTAASIEFSGSTNLVATGIKEATGITLQDSGDLQLGKTGTVSTIIAKASGESGKAVGISVGSDSTIKLDGVNSINSTAEQGTAIGIDLKSNAIADVTGETVVNSATAILAAADSTLSVGTEDKTSQLTVNGTVNNEGKTNLTNATYTVNGSGSELGTIDSKSSSTLAFGEGTYDVANLVSDDTTTVLLNDLSDATQITIAEKSGRMVRAASGVANDQFGSAQDAAKALQDKLSITNDTSVPGTTDDVLIEEGAVNNRLTAKVDANGNLSDVAETKNSKLDALGSVSALSAMTLRHEMNSLSKRMGELRDAPAGVGTWARYYGSEMEYGAQNLTSKNNTIQIGSDYTVGDWKVGIAANYTDGESSYDNGSADNKNYGFAVYGTWFVPCGAYVDLIAKYSRMDNDFALNGMNGSYENNAFNVSAETGYRFEFMDGDLFVEPQVGVSYGRIMGDDFTAQNGVRVEQDDYDSLIGRVGVRTGFKFPKDKGLIYARVSGLYDFQGEMNATATSGSARNTIEEDLGGAWLEIGVGANFNWADNTYSYIDIERTNGGDVKENYRFNVGIRHTF